MSMSSLSAQLASLSNSGGGGSKNAGSSFSASKRHSDAVGRGVLHSTKHGHGISASNARHKPSVLYTDSKAASDVPLTTLRENCVSSLRQLAKLTNNATFVSTQFLQTLAGVHSLQFERGLATASENDKMDAIIGQLLRLLSTAMGESSYASSSSSSATSCFSSSLHVLEYLLRRYDIHKRHTNMEQLLQCVLPHHEQPVFGRVLQLLDLASLPTFSFLRPFAATTTTTLQQFPNRTILAKRASQDNALIRIYCEMAKHAANIHADECSHSLFQTPRKGVSKVLSFCAAVLLEAMTIQTTNAKFHGSLSESTLRTILPFVLSACSGDKNSNSSSGRNHAHYSLGMTCSDWRGFGHVMASCIAEKCVLNMEARETLATAICKGALETERACAAANSSRMEQAAEEQVNNSPVEELVADCLATLMSVISVSPRQSEEDNSVKSTLEQIPSSSQNKSLHGRLGYSLPASTYKVLIQLETLPAALGHLYSDRDLVVAPMAASLIAVTLSWPDKKHLQFDLVSSLIQQDRLEPLWKDQRVDLTASVAASVLTFAVENNLPPGSTPAVIEAARNILADLKNVCAASCDAGIAHAVTAMCDMGKKVDVNRPRLYDILGMPQEELMTMESDVDMMLEQDAVPLLPPRVALEHADANVRLKAIERLMKEPSTVESEGETLEEALLRHFFIEEELKVVIASGEALATLLVDRSGPVSPSFAEGCVRALHRWTVNDDCISCDTMYGDSSRTNGEEQRGGGKVETDNATLVATEESLRAVEIALGVAGHAVKALPEEGDENGAVSIKNQLLRAIIAHTGSSGTRIAAQAFLALCTALRKSENEYKDVSSLLLTTESLLDGLRVCCNGSEAQREIFSESNLFRDYLLVYLDALVGALGTSGSADKSLRQVVADAIRTWFLVIHVPDESRGVGKKEVARIIQYFNTCAEHALLIDASTLLDVITKLSTVDSTTTYNTVCASSINRLCNEYSAAHGVSKLRILMEVALRPSLSDLATLRLLSLASDSMSDNKIVPSPALTEVAIFTLALLGHSDQKVRKAAFKFLDNAKGKGGDGVMDVFASWKSKTSKASTMQIIMEGFSALPTFVSEIIAKSDDPQEVNNELLKLCYQTALSLCASATTSGERWLDLDQGEGGCHAATLVLKALELCGESASPLLLRYNGAGRLILHAYLEEGTRRVTPSISALIRSVALMMKGVTVDDTSVGNEAANVIITTGPSNRGTRARSYSVGRSPGLSFVEPYPKEMFDDILLCLSFQEQDSNSNPIKKELCRAVVHEILGSQSWGDGVLKVIDRTYRKKILTCLFDLWKTASSDGAGQVFLDLKLNGEDLADFARFEGMKEPDLSSVVFLCDYIHAHAQRLRTSPGYAQLISLLLQTLEAVSFVDYVEDEEDEAQFARESVLRVLVGLIPRRDETAGDDKRKRFPKKDLVKWASFLVSLLGGKATKRRTSRSKQLHRLPFGRPKSLAFSILTAFCCEDPKAIVPMLIPALLDSVAADSSRTSLSNQPNRHGRASRDIFISVVPIYFKYAGVAGLSQFDLYKQIIERATSTEHETSKTEFYMFLVDGLMAIPPNEADNSSLVGCFLAALIRSDIQSSVSASTSEMPAAVKYASDLLQLCPSMTQVAAVTQLADFAYQLMLEMSNSDRVDDHKRLSTRNSLGELETAVLVSSSSGESGKQIVRQKMVVAFLAVVSNSLSNAHVMKLIMHGDGRTAKLSLSLWQDLLTLQAASLQNRRREEEQEEEHSDAISRKSLGDECQHLAEACLEQLQSLLPVHLFLASASQLVEDRSDSTELCSRAIRLVSERAAETDPESPEASLFLDMLPMLAQLLDASHGTAATAGDESTMIVQQSVLGAVEVFARSLCLNARKDMNEAFAQVLTHAAALIKAHSVPFEQQQANFRSLVNAPSCQVVCSAALCVSTLVRLLSVKSVSLLPDLVEPLLNVLCSVNQDLFLHRSDWSATSKGYATVLQVSILRALLAIADTLPQFLGPHLDRLVSPSALLSSSLFIESAEHHVSVNATLSKVRLVLSRKIPARQLVPSLCKSLPKCTEHSECQTNLAMLKQSLQEAPRSEVPALRSWLLKALTLAFEFCGVDNEVSLVEEANDVLLALVMKLSEAQLRPSYAKLCEWRGDLESDMDGSEVVVRRHAFWSMSAMLSSQLRSIFLPLLSSVVSDAVKELELAATQLTGSSSVKKIDGGRKRQRLVDPESSSVETTKDGAAATLLSERTLKPLLMCLESALHSDATEGGTWVRHNDSERYHLLLSPLCKLLQLRCGTTTTLPSPQEHSQKGQRASAAASLPLPVSFHQRIIHDEPGCVISCLTTLASAAGNEQLWKPLNHAVLEACGNETRAHVRKAGVSCLLSLMRALGEEYMVLLPECLPVLSELLEESDEEIAGLAQECVSLGEELLGESLQESLR